jgi:hypothetical protein
MSDAYKCPLCDGEVDPKTMRGPIPGQERIAKLTTALMAIADTMTVHPESRELQAIAREALNIE